MDSRSTNDLEDINTVTQAVGKLGNAAQFTAANSERLRIADNAALSMGDIDFTIACWVYLDSETAARPIVAKWNTANFEYKLEYRNAADRFVFSVSQTGAVGVDVTANNLGAVSSATWYFIVCWHDAAGNTINIQVNDGTADSTSHTLGVRDGTSDFMLGMDQSASTFMDGRIDSVSVWKELLSAAEKTWLYNAGNGREYPF